MHRRKFSQAQSQSGIAAGRLNKLISKHLFFIHLIILLAVPLHGIKPDSPTNPSLAVSGPLQLTLRWTDPSNWNTQPGGFQIIVINEDNPLWVHLLDVSAGLTSFNINPDSAKQFSSRAAYPGATDVEDLKLAAGLRYNVYITSVNDRQEASNPVLAPPMRLMAVGKVDAPADVQICDVNVDNSARCSGVIPPLSLLVTWLKPSQTGAGAVAVLPLSRYEIVLSENIEWTSGVTKFNITAADAEGAQGICRGIVPNLQKGKSFFARVRGYNQVGGGEWGEHLLASRVVLSLPGKPTLQFIGSGFSIVPFLTFFWKPPIDSGVGEDLKMNITIKRYEIQIGTNADLDRGVILTKEISNRTALFRGGMVNWTLYSNLDVPLNFGTRYFVRIKAMNGIGFGNWSTVLSRILVQNPGPPRNVRLRTIAPLTMNVTWEAPQDTGASTGIAYPLLSYQVIVKVSGNEPMAGDANVQVHNIPGLTTGLVLLSLEKGLRLFAFVRARNNASDHPDEIEYGYGPWTLGSAACIDGSARPSVCAGYSVIAVDLPTSPKEFRLRPVGGSIIIAQWKHPDETGNGSSLYPLVNYHVAFAKDEQFTNPDIFVAHRLSDRFQSTPGQHTVGQKIFSRVRAVNDAGVSAWSQLASATVLNFPSSPRNLNLTNGNLSILIRFERPMDSGAGAFQPWPLLSYEIEIGTHQYTCPGDTTKKRNLLVANHSQQFKNNFTVIGLVKGCEYSFRMRAKNEAGFGNFTKPNIETFLGLSTMPTNLVAEPGLALQLTLTWNTPEDTGDGTKNEDLVIKYVVQISNSSTFEGVLIRIIETASKMITVEFLPRVPLYVRVYPLTKAGLGHFAQARATPIIPQLTSPSVSLSSLTTGQIVVATVRMTTTIKLMQDDRISVRFPAEFHVEQVELENPPGIRQDLAIYGRPDSPCGTDCQPSPETVTLKYVGTVALPARSVIVLTFQKVKNRRWAGLAGPFELRVLNAAGTFTIAEALNVSHIVLIPGALRTPSITLNDRRTGALNTALVHFVVGESNEWLPDDKAMIEFPPSFDLSRGLFVHDLVVDPSLNLNVGLLQVLSVSMNHLKLARSGGDTIPVNSNIYFSVSNIRNSMFANLSGAIRFNILTNQSKSIDMAIFAGLQFVPGNLTNTSVTPSSPAAYATGTFKACFRCGAVGIPVHSNLVISFPFVNFVKDANFGTAEGIDGTFAFSVHDQDLRVERTGDQTQVRPFSYVCLHFQNIGNYYAGQSFSYSITTLSRSGTIMEQELNVARVMIVPAKLIVERLWLSSYAAGADAQININIMIGGSLNFRGNEGGRIIIEFPSGFELNPEGGSPFELEATIQAPAEGNLALVRTWTGTSVSLYPSSGYTLSTVPCLEKTWFVCGAGAAIELRGGNEWLAGSRFSVRLRGLRTRPFAGITSAFRIYTQNSNNHLSDLHDNSSVQLNPNGIRYVTIGPNPLTTNVTVDMRFSFLTTNVVPEDCRFHISFPPAYTLPLSTRVQSQYAALVLSVIHISRSYLGTNVTILRHRGPLLPRSSNITFTIIGIITRDTSGLSGKFDISTTTSDNNTMDEVRNIEGPYLEYDTSSPRAILPYPNRPSSGNSIVTVTGKGFGESQHIELEGKYRAIRIGQSSCSSTNWISDSSLTCLITAGLLPCSVMVTIETKVGSGSLIFSYDMPSVNSSHVSNVRVSSGRAMLVGANFGKWAQSISVHSGFSAAESTIWTSDSSTFTRTPRSIGGSLSVAITAGHLSGSLNDFVSYDASLLSSVSQSNMPARVHAWMQMGKNFGHSNFCPGLRNHGTQCASTSWISETSLCCRGAAGIRSNETVIALSVAHLVGTLSGALTFDSISLVSFTKSQDESLQAALFTRVRLYHVEGSQFDRVDMSGVITVGNTRCSRTLWTSETRLSCHIDAFVNVKPLNISYSVSHLRTEISASLSFDRPSMSSLSRSNSHSALNGLEIDFFGKNFGAYVQTFQVRMGGSDCLSTRWISDSALVGRLPAAISAAVDIVVSVSRVFATLTGCLSYDAPVLSSTGPHLGWANIPASGHTFLTVTGVNLGILSICQKVRIGMTNCEEQVWASDTSISTKASHGWEHSVQTVITVAQAYGSISNFHSYDITLLALPTSSNLPTISLHRSSTASIQGANFGGYSNSVSGRIGYTSCSSTRWYSQTSLACRSVDGVGSFNTFAVTIARFQVSGSLLLSYDVPSLTVPGPGNSPVRGCEKSMVSSNLGVSEFTLRYRTGDSACAASLWFSDSTLTCKMIAGQGHHLDFIITLFRQKQTIKRSFSYDFPSASRIQAYNSGPSESATHTVLGRSFGIFSVSQQASIGFSNCVMSEWVSDTSITLQTATGLSGRGESVVVSIAMERKITSSAVFTYDGPAILDVTGRAESINADHVTLSGVGFGIVDYTIHAAISTYGCVNTGWIAETSIVCKLNPGIIAGDVTLSAVRDSEFCRKCVPGLELLIDCKKGIHGSAGVCSPCTSCPVGHYRDCAIGGTGVCLPCKNELEYVDERFFKDIEGKGTTQCTQCSICGGRNQDGSFYEAFRCTRDRNTVCQPCKRCPFGIRVGCSEHFAGSCDSIADGVPGITATASGHVYAQQLYDSKYLTIRPIKFRLTGDSVGTSLALDSNTLIDFVGGVVQNLSMSAIVPSEAMLAAAESLEPLPTTRRTMSTRRNKKSRLSMKMLSHVLFFHPSGIRMTPGVNVTIKADWREVKDRSSVALFRWDPKGNSWQKSAEKLTFGEGIIFLTLENFSTYVILGPGNATLVRIAEDGMPYQFLVIILSTLGVLVLLVCVLVFLMRRQLRLYKRKAPQTVLQSPQVRLIDSPNEQRKFVALPPTPGTPLTPRTPRTPHSASPLTPYRAMGNTERTASWKRHLFSREPTRLTSPVPKLSLSSLLRGQRDFSDLNSPNTKLPELSGPADSPYEWGLGSARRLLARSQTPRNDFSTRKFPSRDPTPPRRDLESNLELFDSAFASQMRVIDAARKGMSKDSLPTARPPLRPIPPVPQLTPNPLDTGDQEGPMGFDRLIRTSERARALLSPKVKSPRSKSPIQLSPVPLPEPTFRRGKSLPKQEPKDTILVMSDDYGDKSGVGRDRKQVRYSLPAGRASERAKGAEPRTIKAAFPRAPDPEGALSPRKIEFQDQVSTPDRLRQFPGHPVRQPPRMISTADHHSRTPERHKGPHVRSHASTYSHSPPTSLPRIESEANASRRTVDAHLHSVLPVFSGTLRPASRGMHTSSSTSNDELIRPETPDSIRLRQQHDIMDHMKAEQIGGSLASRSPARAWNQRDRETPTQRVQQPAAAPTWHSHERADRRHTLSSDFRDGLYGGGKDYNSPRSPEFSIRPGARQFVPNSPPRSPAGGLSPRAPDGERFRRQSIA